MTWSLGSNRSSGLAEGLPLARGAICPWRRQSQADKRGPSHSRSLIRCSLVMVLTYGLAWLDLHEHLTALSLALRSSVLVNVERPS